jgi:hypothetical protein
VLVDLVQERPPQIRRQRAGAEGGQVGEVVLEQAVEVVRQHLRDREALLQDPVRALVDRADAEHAEPGEEDAEAEGHAERQPRPEGQVRPRRAHTPEQAAAPAGPGLVTVHARMVTVNPLAGIGEGTARRCGSARTRERGRDAA